MTPEMYDKYDWSFFKTYEGNSWHGKDARFIFWMGRNWILLTVAGFAVAGVVFVVGWFLYKRLILWGKRRAAKGGQSGASIGRGSGRFPLWSKWSGQGRSKGTYELVEQHDA